MYEGGREREKVSLWMCRCSPPLIAVEAMVINRFSQILNRIDFQISIYITKSIILELNFHLQLKPVTDQQKLTF